MVEGLPGIFQRNFTADWGTGTYLIVCADGAGGSDSMRLSVVTSPDSFSSALTNLTAMVAEMSYALEYVAANTALITNMSSNVSDKLEILNARTAATSNSVAAIQSELATIRAIVEENNALLHSLTNAP
jgi:hypothetical protein